MHIQFDVDNFLASGSGVGNVSATQGLQQYEKPYSNNYRTRYGFILNKSINEKLKISFGGELEKRSAGEYQKTDLDNNVLGIQSKPVSLFERALITEVDYCNKKFRTILGARYVSNELSGNSISPELSLIYNVNYERSLKLLFSQGYNSPNM